MAGNLKQFRSILREYKLISDSSRIPGEFQIKVGSYVQIQKAKLCYLEGEYNDSHIVQYVLLEAIKILEYLVVTFPNLEELQFVESTNYRETQSIPLVTSRKCYTYPWLPVYPYGEEWTTNGPLELSDTDDVPQNIFILQNVADDWTRMPKPYPTIFVRVLARGMLYYYGFNKNDKSHPFMAKLVVGDSSSASMCVLFGKGAMSLYYHALPGTILLIEGYSIYKLQNPLYPRLQFSFANRAALELAANESTVDVIGLITHVSLFHRFMYKFGKYHARCYLELIDSSSHLPFVVIIYNNVLRFPVEDIHPGQVLVGTHFKVHHLQDEILSSYQVRTYLKSTHYTELFTTHGQNSLYVRYPAVTAVASIIRDHQQEVDFLQANVLRAGGIPTFLEAINH
ncbi:RPA-related protein RADX [Caerostris extrusa]|uniref:RPA-related protein RADX n=1 Tax=Caerostris extrusa TaxID=172846 RepID=A0AAV4WBI7_CAEEX|nr:RPA-related protein RADX [Caerostris extrusa]